MKIEVPELNSQWFSLDSIEGILIVIFMIFLMIRSGKRVADMIFGFIGIAFVVQILFILGQTNLNNYIPIAKYIKYDCFSAIAQLFPNTNFFLYTLEDLLGSIKNFGG